VAKLTIVVGVLLAVLGVATYLAADPAARSITALIPAAIGVLLAICGVVALNPAYRKHAMHAAVVVALLGFVPAAIRLISKTASGSPPSGLGLFSLVTALILTGGFIVLCVRSFIAARRARTSGESVA
jgi:hypothetical protein